jgi:hypothetical protein
MQGTLGCTPRTRVAGLRAAALQKIVKMHGPRLERDEIVLQSSNLLICQAAFEKALVYGEGFVNVPGTDTCIKAGASVRTEVGGHR